MSNKDNILVISDLHLGEDLSPATTDAVTRQLEISERQLIDFLRYYTHRRKNGLPWRLVINGDMVDFLQVCVLPNDERLANKRTNIDADERVHGLRRRPEVARVKMAAVVQRHQNVFRALALFIANGNAVDVICGNHDIEFHWPVVQEAFREGIVNAYREVHSDASAQSVTGIRDKISFHPWFYYEPGVVWIEHGHQYDACCSFEHCLEPTSPTGEHIAPNIDSAGLRYVTNQIVEAEPHAQAEWSMLGHMRFAFGLGARGLIRLAGCYYLFALAMLRVWKGYSPWSKANKRQNEDHHAQMKDLAQKWQIPFRTLRQVDDLRRRPVVTHLRRLLGVLMLDTALIYTGMILGIVGMFVVFSPMPALVGTGLIIAGARVLHRRADRVRVINPEVTMRLIPERILRHVDARFVLFGHTHEPLCDHLGEDKWHFNTGTWMPTGKPGLLRSFTHVVIEQHEHGPSAQLCQWRDGASRSFTPNWAPAEETVSQQPVAQPAAAGASIEVQQAA